MPPAVYWPAEINERRQRLTREKKLMDNNGLIRVRSFGSVTRRDVMKGAAAMGADALLIEVHPNPA